MENKKYILTNETIKVEDGSILYRIRAVKDFGDVHNGDYGGWIESESNLSQEDDCWVYDEARVTGDSRVYGHAKVRNFAWVYDYAEVFDYAVISDNARIWGHARIYNNAEVSDYAMVYNYAWVYDKASVSEYSSVYGYARVFGDAEIYGRADICGDAEIESFEDYAVHKNNWSTGRYFTWTRSNNKWKVGCFYGSGEELIKKAYEDSETKGECYETIVKAQEAILNIL